MTIHVGPLTNQNQESSREVYTFKIVHNRIVNNELLKEMRIADVNNCLYCNQLWESPIHMHIECENITCARRELDL